MMVGSVFVGSGAQRCVFVTLHSDFIFRCSSKPMAKQDFTTWVGLFKQSVTSLAKRRLSYSLANKLIDFRHHFIRLRKFPLWVRCISLKDIQLCAPMDICLFFSKRRVAFWLRLHPQNPFWDWIYLSVDVETDTRRCSFSRQQKLPL